MDLRAEPIVLSVPAVERSRYYSVMLCDGNTFNYGHIGSRATGTQRGDYMVVGPDWKGETPAGIKKVFHSSTQFSAAAETVKPGWPTPPSAADPANYLFEALGKNSLKRASVSEKEKGLISDCIALMRCDR